MVRPQPNQGRVLAWVQSTGSPQIDDNYSLARGLDWPQTHSYLWKPLRILDAAPRHHRLSPGAPDGEATLRLRLKLLELVGGGTLDRILDVEHLERLLTMRLADLGTWLLDGGRRGGASADPSGAVVAVTKAISSRGR